MRLALLRALGASLLVGAPLALCIATVTNDVLASQRLGWDTTAWLVLAGHAGLGVGAASLAEEWGLRRDRPRAAALLACAASLALVLAGVAHGLWIGHLVRTGSVAESWRLLQPFAAWCGANPVPLLVIVANAAALFTVAWALPLGMITHERVRPSDEPPLLLWLNVLTCGGTTIVFLVLAVVYALANVVDARLGLAPLDGDP